jgi:hypothetical protein
MYKKKESDTEREKRQTKTYLERKKMRQCVRKTHIERRNKVSQREIEIKNIYEDTHLKKENNNENEERKEV